MVGLMKVMFACDDGVGCFVVVGVSFCVDYRECAF